VLSIQIFPPLEGVEEACEEGGQGSFSRGKTPPEKNSLFLKKSNARFF
jgi:hypothetical protein